MQQGPYQQPQRNRRSERASNIPYPRQAAQVAAKTVQQKAHPQNKRKKKKHPLFSTAQWITLGVLAVVLLITVISSVNAQDSLNSLLKERAASERAWQQEIARHKVLYEDEIRYYAAVNNIDPAFVAAVIKRESDYDPYAVSNKGARGLMQFMPDSFEWIAPKFGIASTDFDAIYQPENAIKMGCYLLKYISDKYDGDPILTACAYHAGWGNVNSWLQKFSSDGKTLTIDEIPLDDTKYYARKVLEAYAIYQQHHY